MTFTQDQQDERLWEVTSSKGHPVARITWIHSGFVLIDVTATSSILLSTLRLLEQGATKIANEGPGRYTDLQSLNTANRGLIRWFSLGISHET